VKVSTTPNVDLSRYSLPLCTTHLIGLKFLLWVPAFGGLTFLLAGSPKLKRKHAIANVSQDYSPPVSLLKPLCSIDPELQKNLETFFRQDYPVLKFFCRPG
jgi:hypothetical protein